MIFFDDQVRTPTFYNYIGPQPLSNHCQNHLLEINTKIAFLELYSIIICELQHPKRTIITPIYILCFLEISI